jgi:hypothetical protein
MLYDCFDQLKPLLMQFVALEVVDVSLNPFRPKDLFSFVTCINRRCPLRKFVASPCGLSEKQFGEFVNRSTYPYSEATLVELYCEEVDLETFVDSIAYLFAFRSLQELYFGGNEEKTSLAQKPEDIVASTYWAAKGFQVPPKETIQGGWNSILKFSRNSEFERVYKMRLMFIGRGISGKTRLIKELMHKKSSSMINVDTGRTIGIDISNEVLILPGVNGQPDIHAVLWDFAGQELSYLSHSIHLSARCVYVLVWSPRQEGNQRVRDSVDNICVCLCNWLQILSSHVPDA